MNIDKKIAILLKLKAKGFHISQKLERNLTDSFEAFYEERIREKEKIIKVLKEIEAKLAEKKIPNLNENVLLALLTDKIVSDNSPALLNFYSLN